MRQKKKKWILNAENLQKVTILKQMVKINLNSCCIDWF